jgi:hypothetical protein
MKRDAMEVSAFDPSQRDFVLSPDTSQVVVHRRADYDLYVRPSDTRVPLVVLVHGPVRDGSARPREWPVYCGYGALAANAGVAAVVADLDYTDVCVPEPAFRQLERLVDAAQFESAVDPSRVVVWAFSGGASLVGSWLESPPEWLKGIALTYPLAPPVAYVTSVARPEALEKPLIAERARELVHAGDGVELGRPQAQIRRRVEQCDRHPGESRSTSCHPHPANGSSQPVSMCQYSRRSRQRPSSAISSRRQPGTVFSASEIRVVHHSTTTRLPSTSGLPMRTRVSR